MQFWSSGISCLIYISALISTFWNSNCTVIYLHLIILLSLNNENRICITL